MTDHARTVKADDLGFRYRQHVALDGLRFSLAPGITGLVGINGAGKSTLLRLLATTQRPDAGRLWLLGVEASGDVRTVRRRIGYMPQELQIPARLRVGDFLAYMGWLRQVPPRRRRDAIGAALAAADLEDRVGDTVGSLSGGMRRRLLLAQALLGDPELLLLDEPTAGLDPEQRIRIRELIAGAAASRTTVVSSHLMEDLVPVADRVLMLDEGRLVFDGTVEEMGARGAALVTEGSGLSAHEAAFLSLRGGGR